MVYIIIVHFRYQHENIPCFFFNITGSPETLVDQNTTRIFTPSSPKSPDLESLKHEEKIVSNDLKLPSQNNDEKSTADNIHEEINFHDHHALIPPTEEAENLSDQQHIDLEQHEDLGRKNIPEKYPGEEIRLEEEMTGKSDHEKIIDDENNAKDEKVGIFSKYNSPMKHDYKKVSKSFYYC